MSLITFRGWQVSIPQEAYGLVWRIVPKMNEGLTRLEQHEGE